MLLAGSATSLACVDRTRLNQACTWSEDASPLDVADPGQERHLIEDVQLAEELGVRYGDTVLNTEGVRASLARRDECTDALFSRIAALHGVSNAEIAKVRGRRDVRIDLLVVGVPVALLLSLMSWYVSGRILRRFPDEAPAAVLSTLLLSLVVGGLMLAAGDLWSWLVESARLGNSHLSYRAGYRPWRPHLPALFASAVLVFWFLALIRYRRRSSAPSSPRPTGPV